MIPLYYDKNVVDVCRCCCVVFVLWCVCVVSLGMVFDLVCCVALVCCLCLICVCSNVVVLVLCALCLFVF